MTARPTEQTEELFQLAQRIAENLDPTAGDTETEKILASVMIDLRASIVNGAGLPDWFGQTREYRWRAQFIHSLIEGDETAVSRLKGRLRQHYLRILNGRVDKKELAAAMERAERSPLPLDSNFFDDIGVYIREYGRHSSNSEEAHTLALVAGKLLGMIDTSKVDFHHVATLRMTLEQTVEDTVKRLIDELKRR